MSPRTALLVLLAFTSALFVSGCATPYDIGNADVRVTPQEAVNDMPRRLDRHVAWGGKITAVKNLPNKTELEAVAYPFDSRNRPDEDAAPSGRFIVIHPGYLEPADYAPGRLITVVGTVNEARHGKVGEASYVYPVVTATKLQLWPKPSAENKEPRIHFGVGVGIIR